MSQVSKYRFVVSDLIDVVYDQSARKVFVDVAGKHVQQCMFLVATISRSSPVNSIDELAQDPRARSMEGHSMLPPEEELLGHASNIQAWYENDYDTRLLHSNIAFPLLKTLAKHGDAKATRVLEAEVDERAINGTTMTRTVILDTAPQYLTKKGWAAYANEKNIDLRIRAVKDPNIDSESLELFVKDPNLTIRISLASNKKATDEMLEELIKGDAQIIRKEISINEKTGVGLISKIVDEEIKKKEDTASVYIAGRRNIDIAIIRKMDSIGSINVTRRLASNPKTPVDLIQKYAKSNDKIVRMNVAANVSAPEEILEELMNDPDKMVQTFAKRAMGKKE